MTYIFNKNNNIVNEVEIKNDVGNTIPITVYHQSLAVGNSNPLPVTLGSENINIIGNIAVPTTVNVASSPDNPVHVHLTELGIPGNTGNGIILTTFVPIQGNVSINGIPTINIGNEIEIKNNSGDPISISGNVVATINNSESNPTLIKYVDGSNIQLDTQQRLRIATQGQQWWYVPSIDKDGDLRFVESFSGANANSYYIQNLASVKLTSGTDSNGSAIRSSRRRHKIRPGVSHQFFSVHSFDGSQDNNITRVGMFTNFNGMFFELNDDLCVVVRKRLIDGTLAEDKVTRRNFNVDKLDGTGLSGYDFTSNTNQYIYLSGYSTKNTVNVASGTDGFISNTQVFNVTYTTSNAVSNTISLGTKVTVSGITPISFNGVASIQNIDNANSKITLSYTTNPGTYSSMSSGLLKHTKLHNEYTWWFDFNGGRTGKIRFGINSPNGPSVMHMFDYGGTIGQQYESAPALMDRIEIINTGPVSYLPSLTTAGTTFNVEAEVELSPGFAVARNNTYVNYSKGSGQEFPILGIALRAGEPYQRGDIQVKSLDIVDLGNINPQNSGVYFWRLLLNPTIGGYVPQETWLGKCTRQWAYAANTTFSGGYELMGGYSSSVSIESVETILNFINLGSNISYTDSDKVVLVIKELVGGTSDGHIVATMNIIEAL